MSLHRNVSLFVDKQAAGIIFIVQIKNWVFSLYKLAFVDNSGEIIEH